MSRLGDSSSRAPVKGKSGLGEGVGSELLIEEFQSLVMGTFRVVISSKLEKSSLPIGFESTEVSAAELGNL